MAQLETLPIQATIYVPENKRSAWVYPKGSNIAKSRNKELQGTWVIDGYTLDKKKASTEIWIFDDDDEIEIDRRVLENNPLQGTWGFAPQVGEKKTAVRNIGKINPNDIWFFPPKSAKCKIPTKLQEYIHVGTWVNPTFKRNFSQLGSNKQGFLTVSGDMRIAKGEKHSVTGKWNMMGYNDDVVRGRKKNQDTVDARKRPWEIFVRKPNGVRFPITVIPGNKIVDCKHKIKDKKGIPIEDQRLSFNDVPLKDEKTVVGSRIKNGDTIDLGPMIIYVRNVKGKKFTFEVDPDEMVDDVKKMVERREGTPVPKQRLYFKDVKMLDGKPISHFKVKHKSILDLKPMIIYVQPLGKAPRIELEVEETDPLKSVKVKVKNRIKVPVAEQRLVFQEKEMLKDGAPLESYGVQHLDTLFMRKDDNLPGKTSPKKRPQNPVKERTKPPLVTVKTPQGDLTVPIVPQKDTVKDVKEKVGKELGIPPEKVILKPTTTKNPRTLKNTDRPAPGEVLTMSPKKDAPNKPKVPNKRDKEPKPEIMIRVPGKYGSRNFQLDLDPDDTIDDLKKDVARLTGIPPKEIHLLDKDNNVVDSIDPSQKNHTFDVAPQIEVLLPDKSKIKLIVLPKKTVEDIKDAIEDKTSIPKAKQRLFFWDDENELHGGTPISQTAITPGTLLELKPPKEVYVNVKLPDNRNFFLDFDPDNDTLENIKKKVAKKLDVPAKTFDLVKDNHIVDDSYKPRNGHTLDVAPHIEILLPDKSKIKLTGLPQMNINDVKRFVEEEKAIPSDRQRVFFLDGDKELDGSTPLPKTGINLGDTLEIRPVEDQVVTVRKPDGRRFVIVINPINDRIKDIKRKLAAELCVPVKKLPPILIDGHETDDDYHPSKGDILDLDVPVIDVELPDRSKVQMAVMPAKTVGEMMDELEDEIGLKKKEHRVFVFDNEIEEVGDTVPLSKIQGSTVAIQRLGSGPEQIEVREPKGRAFPFVIDPEESVENLKKRLSDKVGFSIGGLRLGDKEWDDKNDRVPVSRLNIRPGGILVAEPRKLEIELPNGKKISLQLMPTMTIRDLEEVIEEQFPELCSKDDGRMLFFHGDTKLHKDTPLEKVALEIGKKIEMRSMEVYIKHWGGETFVLDAQSNWYIGDIEDLIFQTKNIPQDEQRLHFDGKPVNDQLQLLKQGIVHRSTLTLEQMQIRVQVPSQKEPLILSVDSSDLIKEVKRSALKKINTVSIADPCLVFGGEELEENQTLVGCKVQHDDLLTLEGFFVSVMHWSGDVYPLARITRSNTVAELKGRIFQERDIPIKEQSLSLDCRRLSDSKTLKSEKVRHKAIIVLEPLKRKIILPGIDKKSLKQLKRKNFKSKGDDEIWPVMPDWKRRIFFFDNDESLDSNIELSIMHCTGETFKLDKMLLSMKVNQIKDKIYKLKGIAKKKQKLKLNGRLLDGKKTLREQAVWHKSILTLESPKKNTILTPGLDKITLNTLPTKLVSEISIKVKHWKGDIFELSVDPHEYMDDIRDRIFALKNIPVEDQRLSFQDAAVREEQNLLEQNIKEGSILTMEKMCVYVNIPGKTKPVSVFVERDDKIGKIKKNLVKGTKTNVETVFLMFAGKELDNKKTISDCNIGHDDILTMEHFKLFIMGWSGEGFEVKNVNPHDTISNVKKNISKTKAIPMVHHKLLFKGQMLNDALSIQKQGIKHRTVLILEPPDDEASIASSSIASSNGKMSFPFLNEAANIGQAGSLMGSSFLLQIKHWNGEMFSISAEPSEYIDDVKEKIWSSHKIPLDYQLLKDKGKFVSEELTLEDQDISDSSILELALMDVSVELPCGETTIIGLIFTDTIWMAKKLLKKKSGIQIQDQCLMLGGVELSDTNSVSECNIHDNSKLILESFKIMVVDKDGEVFEVDRIKRNGTVEDVKKRISKIKSMSKGNQVLNFNGEELSNSAQLKDKGIGHKSIVLLEPKAKDLLSPRKAKKKQTSASTNDTADLTDAERLPSSSSLQQSVSPGGKKKWWERGKQNKNGKSNETKKSKTGKVEKSPSKSTPKVNKIKLIKKNVEAG